jgi:hypothetical protein
VGSGPALHDRIRAGCLDWCLDDSDAFGLEHSVEGAGELGIPVADQEPEFGRLVAEVEQEVAGLLGNPRGGWVGGDAHHVDPAAGVLYDSEAVQPCEGDGLGVEKSHARMPAACTVRNSFQLGPDRRGAGPMPCAVPELAHWL